MTVDAVELVSGGGVVVHVARSKAWCRLVGPHQGVWAITRWRVGCATHHEANGAALARMRSVIVSARPQPTSCVRRLGCRRCRRLALSPTPLWTVRADSGIFERYEMLDAHDVVTVRRATRSPCRDKNAQSQRRYRRHRRRRRWQSIAYTRRRATSPSTEGTITRRARAAARESGRRALRG